VPATYYPAVLTRTDTGFALSFLDFSDVSVVAESRHDALLQAEVAIAIHLKWMAEDGMPIPAPTDFDMLQPVSGGDQPVHVLVRTTLPGTVSQIQVTLEDALLAAIDARSGDRSMFLAAAAWDAVCRPVASPIRGGL